MCLYSFLRFSHQNVATELLNNGAFSPLCCPLKQLIGRHRLTHKIALPKVTAHRFQNIPYFFVLNTFCDYGAVGGALAAFFLAMLLGDGVRSVWKRSRINQGNETMSSVRSLLLAGAVAGLIAIAIHSFFDFNLHIRANLLAAAFLAGMVVALRVRDVDQPGKSSALTLVTLAVVGGTAVAGLLWQAQRAARESYYLTKAARAEAAVASATEPYLAALGVEPGNPETHMQLGHHYRQRSQLGEADYEVLGEQALAHYEQAEILLPASPWPPMNCGLCLDWLGRGDEAATKFNRMLQLDPRSKRVRAMMGWHYFQREDYPLARQWIQKSFGLPHGPDVVASSYDKLLRERGF